MLCSPVNVGGCILYLCMLAMLCVGLLSACVVAACAAPSVAACDAIVAVDYTRPAVLCCLVRCLRVFGLELAWIVEPGS